MTFEIKQLAKYFGDTTNKELALFAEKHRSTTIPVLDCLIRSKSFQWLSSPGYSWAQNYMTKYVTIHLKMFDRDITALHIFKDDEYIGMRYLCI